MELVFASHNENKVNEIRPLLPHGIELKSLNDLGFYDEIEENGHSLEENAEIKARTIYEKFGVHVFADDTGLFVDVLDGAPGIYSARYARTGDSKDNIRKLKAELQDKENRSAHFKTVICLIMNGETHFLAGKVEGEILEEERGEDGFGYDPVFQPTGFGKTFAEMDLADKNKISHRALAVQNLIKFIEKLQK